MVHPLWDIIIVIDGEAEFVKEIGTTNDFVLAAFVKPVSNLGINRDISIDLMNSFCYFNCFIRCCLSSKGLELMWGPVQNALEVVWGCRPMDRGLGYSRSKQVHGEIIG